MSSPIVLPPLGAPVDELWGALLDLGERLTVPWALIGGQMVLLHVIERGAVPPQISQDADVIADIRGAPGGLREVVAALDKLGFHFLGVAPDGIGHRYARASHHPGRPATVDVLAPEGVGERADLTTTPPGRTVRVPGGSQALARAERVVVIAGGRQGEVPRPTLLGAVVTKAAACGLPGDPARHLRDLALLCSLVDDPFASVAELNAKDRKRLRLASALDNDTDPAWLLVPEHLRADGQVAWAVLSGHRFLTDRPEQPHGARTGKRRRR